MCSMWRLVSRKVCFRFRWETEIETTFNIDYHKLHCGQKKWQQENGHWRCRGWVRRRQTRFSKIQNMCDVNHFSPKKTQNNTFFDLGTFYCLDCVSTYRKSNSASSLSSLSKYFGVPLESLFLVLYFLELLMLVASYTFLLRKVHLKSTNSSIANFFVVSERFL